jgi:hypothetical protein
MAANLRTTYLLLETALSSLARKFALGKLIVAQLTGTASA